MPISHLALAASRRREIVRPYAIWRKPLRHLALELVRYRLLVNNQLRRSLPRVLASACARASNFVRPRSWPGGPRHYAFLALALVRASSPLRLFVSCACSSLRHLALALVRYLFFK